MVFYGCLIPESVLCAIVHYLAIDDLIYKNYKDDKDCFEFFIVGAQKGSFAINTSLSQTVLGVKTLIRRKTKLELKDFRVCELRSYSRRCKRKKVETLRLSSSSNPPQWTLHMNLYNHEKKETTIIDDKDLQIKQTIYIDSEIETKDIYMAIYRVQKENSQTDTIQIPIKVKNQINNNSKPLRGRKSKYQARDKTITTQSNILSYFLSGQSQQKSNPTTNHKEVLSDKVKDTLEIVYTNIRSVNANKYQLEAYIERNSPSILVLTETWRLATDAKISLQHDYYNILEKRRNNRTGGGLAIMTDKSLQAFDYSQSNSEFVLSVKLLPKQGHKEGTLFIVAFYAPPNKKQEAIADLKSELQYLSLRYKNADIIILGDHNAEESSGPIKNLKDELGFIGINEMRVRNN